MLRSTESQILNTASRSVQVRRRHFRYLYINFANFSIKSNQSSNDNIETLYRNNWRSLWSIRPTWWQDQWL